MKTSCNPLGFGAPGPRFVALEVNEMKAPPVDTVGFVLAPLAGAMTPLGAVPSVEIRKVVGVQVLDVAPPHVLRTNTCGVTPSNVTFDTRFVASDANTTKSPSELIEGLKLGPFPALSPSADMDTNWASFPVPVQVCCEVPLHVGRQNTWVIRPVWGTLVVKFVAVEVKAASPPELLIEGSELAPFAALPLGSVVTIVVDGAQEPDPRHVLLK